MPPVEQDIRNRVNSVLHVVLRELQLGVNEMTWPELAFNDLPKDIRDRIVTASEDTHIYEAIKPWADPPLLDQVWAYLSETHANHEWYRKWLLAGVDWIKVAATGNLPVVEDE